jgi:hypothetical protein
MCAPAEVASYACVTRVSERCAELFAGTDVAFREHLAQVVLDRTGADEELGADLGVRAPVSSAPGDLRLLRR